MRRRRYSHMTISFFIMRSAGHIPSSIHVVEVHGLQLGGCERYQGFGLVASVTRYGLWWVSCFALFAGLGEYTYHAQLGTLTERVIPLGSGVPHPEAIRAK